MTVQVATWNVNSLRVRSGHVMDWLRTHQPDVMALQETKIRDTDFPVDDFRKIGYTATCHGQPTYNGVALLSRSAPHDIRTGIPGYDDPQCRILFADFPAAGCAVLNLYVPNGAAVDTDKYQYKLTWLQHVREYISTLRQHHERLIVTGDFNIAPQDIDVHEPQLWHGKVLCSDPERQAFHDLLRGANLLDTFRHLHPETRAYSWWDYRQAAFRRDQGLRIDLVLHASGLQPRSCVIDKEARARERPSDHAPVAAVFA